MLLLCAGGRIARTLYPVSLQIKGRCACRHMRMFSNLIGKHVQQNTVGHWDTPIWLKIGKRRCYMFDAH
jgi:hypothetical protein